VRLDILTLAASLARGHGPFFAVGDHKTRLSNGVFLSCLDSFVVSKMEKDTYLHYMVVLVKRPAT